MSLPSPSWSRHHGFSIAFVSVRSNFFCYDKIPEKNQLLMEKLYLGSWFLISLSMVINLAVSELTERQNIVVGSRLWSQTVHFMVTQNERDGVGEGRDKGGRG